jgi:hypothetical protein
LRGNSDAIARSHDRTLNNGVDIQLLCDLRERPVLFPLSHDRRAGDDAEIGDARDLRDELVGHAIGKVFL